MIHHNLWFQIMNERPNNNHSSGVVHSWITINMWLWLKVTSNKLHIQSIMSSSPSPVTPISVMSTTVPPSPNTTTTPSENHIVWQCKDAQDPGTHSSVYLRVVCCCYRVCVSSIWPNAFKGGLLVIIFSTIISSLVFAITDFWYLFIMLYFVQLQLF